MHEKKKKKKRGWGWGGGGGGAFSVVTNLSAIAMVFCLFEKLGLFLKNPRLTNTSPPLLHWTQWSARPLIPFAKK